MSKSFSVEVRDTGGNLLRVTDGMAWEVGAYSGMAVGGCDEASLSVRGDRALLWGLTDWLRYQVLIRNEHGNAVWWGYIAAVDVQLGGIAIGVDLESVRNRVCVAYTYRGADGSQLRETTAWAEDAASQARCGIHEERLSMGDIAADVATSRRHTYLTLRSEPARTLSLVAGENGATVRCLGFWHQTAWRHWEQPAGLVEYAGEVTCEHLMSFALTSTEIAFRKPTGLEDVLGRLDKLTKGTRIIVSGSANNDNEYTVAQPPGENDTAIAYTSTGIWFDPADDIFDTNQGLSPFSKGDTIKVSGSSSSNDGYWKVNTDGDDRMEVNPKNIVHVDSGPSVTIRRGHRATIEESFYDSANPGPSITLLSIGTMLAQSFTLPFDANWPAHEVVIHARRIGAPGDSLRVAIVTDNSGSPSATLLANATVSGSSLSEEMAPVLFTLTSNPTLSYGTTYWLVVDRTGSSSTDNFYAIGLDEGLGYASGLLKEWRVALWQAHVPDCDLPFEIWGQRETTLQVADMVASVLPSVAIENASGVMSRQWRNGEQTVRQEAEELLAAGTSAGKRLLAQVSPQQMVRIYSEPEPSNLDWQLGMDGRLRLPLGAIDEGQLPAGEWVQLQDEAQGLGPLFIERAQYTPGQGYTLLEPRSSAPWESWT